MEDILIELKNYKDQLINFLKIMGPNSIYPFLIFGGTFLLCIIIYVYVLPSSM